MLYAGKRLEELTNDELDEAAVYLTRKVVEHSQMAELNKAGLVELGLEYERRLSLPDAPRPPANPHLH